MKTTKIWLALAGILFIILGILCICSPTETIFAAAWLIGLFTLLSGIIKLAFTFYTQAFLPNSASRALSAILQIILMAILSRYGMHTMVIGFVTLSCMWVLVWHYFTKRLTGYGIIMFFKDTIPFALIALGVMVVTHYLTSSIESLWMLLISRVIIAAALYFIVMKMAHAKILDECLQFLNRRKQ